MNDSAMRLSDDTSDLKYSQPHEKHHSGMTESESSDKFEKLKRIDEWH
ncbi:hypothetical protein [Succinimonas sp.]